MQNKTLLLGITTLVCITGVLFMSSADALTQRVPQSSTTPEPPTPPQPTKDTKYSLRSILTENTRECSTDLLGLENNEAIQTLSVVPSLCITYTNAPTFFNLFSFVKGAGIYQKYTTTISIFTDRAISQRRKQKTLVHELCHANQHYYIAYQADKKTIEEWHTPESKKLIHITSQDMHKWHSTPSGEEFIDITGFTRSTGFLGLGINREWQLSEDNPYRFIYGKNPLEVSAEVCGMFLSPHAYGSVYGASQINSILNNQHLREWFNKYVSDTQTTHQSSTTIGYREDGSIKYKWFHRPDKTIERIELYYTNGMSIEYYRPDGTQQRTDYYTEDGKIILQKRYYRADGTIKYRDFLRADGTLQQRQYEYMGRREGIKRQTLFYQEDGKTILQIQHFDVNGIRKQVDFFDKEGRIKHKRYYEDGDKIKKTIHYD